MRGRILYFAAILALACSCSTTRVLNEGEYRLEENTVTIDGDAPELKINDIGTYIRQQPQSTMLFGWSPALSIYNWSGHSDGAFARLFRKIGKAPTVYNPISVPNSIDNISRHLEYLGYYNSTVTASVDTNGRKVKVNYKIKPGKQYTISRIEYSLPDSRQFASDFSADSLNMLVRDGSILSEALMEQESARGAEFFRRRGYFGFTKGQYFFIADTLNYPGMTVLQYQIKDYTRSGGPKSAQPIEKYRIGDVTFTYPESLKIRPEVLRQLNTIRPGSVYNEMVVSNTYNRLSSLKVLNSVSIEMTPVDTAKVNCDIALSQSKLQGIKANLEASIHSTGLMGVSPQLNYFHKNVFHGGEWLNVNVMGNFQFKWDDRDVHSNEWGITANLDIPRIIFMPYTRIRGTSIPHTDIKLAYNYQSRPEFTRNIASAGLGFSGTALRNRILYEIAPFNLNYVSLSDIDEDFSKTLEKNPFMKYSYQDHLDAGVSGTIYYSTNMDLVPKTSYHYTRFSLDLSGNILSAFKSAMNTNESGQGMILGAPFTQYIRGELTLGRTLRFGSDNGMSLAGRVLLGAGYAYGNSTALPYEKQFYCGGANSLRGWQARSVGPGFDPLNESFSIPSQTGDLKFETNLEYRSRLFSKVEGAVFADVGNVWNTKSYEDSTIDFIGSLAGDWGLGIRLNLDFILIRIDAGFKVHDPARAEGERWVGPSQWLKRNGYAIHFGVGYPF